MKNRRHRIWIGLNNSAALLLASLIVLMVNYLSYRHYYRADLSSSRFYNLSPKTVRLLESVPGRVDVTVFFQPGNVLYENIHNLIREYQSYSQNLNVQWVDPDRDLALTEEMAVKYEVTEPNIVVFSYGDRSDYVRIDEIAQIDESRGAPRILSFRGEQAFSSAILGVVQQNVPVIYFLTGHGERDINNFDQRNGFSGIRRLIERDNAHVKTLELSTQQQIPSDCDLLIVAGASTAMAPTEAELIEAWLQRSGRLMVLADAGRTSGLEDLLRQWGVFLRDDLVLDPARTLTGREVFVSAYTTHPIANKLSTTAAIFHLPRSVEPSFSQSRAADRAQVTPLALSSEESWSESQPTVSPATLDEQSGDLAGPISLAVAVEKGSPQGVLDMQIDPSRMVVFGDSGFISNGGLTGGDISLFMSSVNWLLDREQLMAIAPKEVSDTRLKLTRGDTSTLFWSTVFGVPGLSALFGFILWLMRRK